MTTTTTTTTTTAKTSWTKARRARSLSKIRPCVAHARWTTRLVRSLRVVRRAAAGFAQLYQRITNDGDESDETVQELRHFLREHLLRDAEGGGDERADREEIENFLAAMDVQQLRHSCMMLILQQQGELDDAGMAAQLDALQDIVAAGDDFLDEEGDSDAEAGGAEDAA